MRALNKILVAVRWLPVLLLAATLLDACHGFAASRPLALQRHPLHSRGVRLSMSFPEPPALKTLPLPVILAGGLFLFRSSVKPQNREFADELLAVVQRTLRADPVVSMELGQGIETGGVYASTATSTEMNDSDGKKQVDQLVLQFQINGGNAWAQGVACGLKDSDTDSNVRLVSLEIANMDAMMFGQASAVTIPPQTEMPE